MMKMKCIHTIATTPGVAGGKFNHKNSQMKLDSNKFKIMKIIKSNSAKCFILKHVWFAKELKLSEPFLNV